MTKQVYNHNETVDKALFRRLNYIFDNFENIQVSISGGRIPRSSAGLPYRWRERETEKSAYFS